MRTRQNLTKAADRVFSKYVRHRGSEYGYNHCFTCGVYRPIEELQAGHFISRRYLHTRWHPLNVWPQCNHCNVELHGNITVYKAKLVSLYSQDAIDGLWVLARIGNRVTDYEIEEIIKKYKIA